MNQKTGADSDYAVYARQYISARRDELKGKTAELFTLLYEKEPTKMEEQTLRNRLNRGNLSADFLGLCVDKLQLEHKTLGELFSLPNKRR